MIKGSLFITALLCLVFSVSAQHENQRGLQNKVDILPPSPNAASLGAYGGLTPSLITGAAAVSVPVYNLKVADHDIGVSLSYSSSGFRVDDPGTQLGSGGWSLLAGGVISRVVCGVPDERGTKIMLPEPVGGNEPELLKAIQGARTDDGLTGYDGQPDQFSFNFMGYSGKFILDRTMTPVLLEYSNLKIDYAIDPQTNYIGSFKLTTPDGVQYIFDKAENTRSTSDCSMHGGPFGVTAWYLTRVVLANGEEVTLQYIDYYIEYNTAVSETMYRMNSFTEGCVNGSSCPNLQPNTCTNSYQSSSFLLSRIDSRAGSITFNYIDRRNANTGAILNNGGQLLKTIAVLDPAQQPIKSFTLDYQDVYCEYGSDYSHVDEANRSFLTTLNEHDRFGAIVRKHRFEYNNLSGVPARLSFSQDHWGYYNNQYNTTLIPRPESASEQLEYPNASANREPNAGAAATGLLTKVIYPTGGYEQLEYEGNTVNVDKQIFDPPIGLSAYVRGNPQIPTQSVTTTKTITIGVGQAALLTLHVPAVENESHPFVFFTFTDVTDGIALYNESLEQGSHVEKPVELRAGHTYVIESMTRGANMQGNAVLTYSPGTSHFVNVNELVGGVRVKSVLAAASENEAPVVKFYYYAALNTLNRSSGGAYTTPNETYRKPVRTRVTCVAGESAICTNYALYSSSQLNLFIYSGNIQYRVVTESIGGPNFENGGIQHTYTLAQDYQPSAIRGDVITGCPYTNSNIYSGKEKETYIFNKDKLPVEKRVYEYTDDPAQSKTFHGYAANVRMAQPPFSYDWPSADQLDSYNFSEYQIYSRWIYKSKDTVYKYDQDGNASLLEVQEYEYKKPMLALPTQTNTYTSTGDKKITTLQYPIDYTVVPNKTPFQAKIDLDNAVVNIDQVYNTSITDLNNQIRTAIAQKNTGVIPGLNSSKNTTENNRNLAIGNAVLQYKASLQDYNNALDQAINNNADEQQKAILAMQKRNISPVIQTRECKNSLSNELSVSENRYKLWDANNVKTHYVNTGFKGHAPEPILTFSGYDYKGNILGYKEQGKPSTSVYWGYANNYPIASAVNAGAGEIFFDSFEGAGTWNGITLDQSMFHTGRMSGKIDNPNSGELYYHSNAWLNVSLSQPTKFHYSGWVYSNGPSADIFLFMKRAGETGYFTYVDYIRTTEINKWVFVEKDFDVPADVTQMNIRIDNNSAGTVWFDDIRLHPSLALMTTYTYDPLIGVTSQTDANNIVMYYEYDAFGRLRTVKDRDGNILKTMEYHYKAN